MADFPICFQESQPAVTQHTQDPKHGGFSYLLSRISISGHSTHTRPQAWRIFLYACKNLVRRSLIAHKTPSMTDFPICFQESQPAVTQHTQDPKHGGFSYLLSRISISGHSTHTRPQAWRIFLYAFKNLVRRSLIAHKTPSMTDFPICFQESQPAVTQHTHDPKHGGFSYLLSRISSGDHSTHTRPQAWRIFLYAFKKKGDDSVLG
nr:hypothetical protein Itr_chr05CG24030 [Ipomoea trifida]